MNERAEYSSPAPGTTSNSTGEPATVVGAVEERTNSNVGPVSTQPTPAPPGIIADATPLKNTSRESDQVIVSSDTIAKDRAPGPGGLMDRSRDPGVGDKPQEQIAAAPASNTPVPSAPPPEPQKRERQEEQKKTKASVSDGEGTSAGGNTGNVTMAEQTQADEPRRDGGRIATARGRAPRAQRSGGDKSAPSLGAVSEKEDSGESRNVGGRRFHRRGSAWVDAAFTSSRSAIDVRRGSEQYRALVADEPGLRSIAEQLSGEVIVVWKSRAYRFH